MHPEWIKILSRVTKLWANVLNFLVYSNFQIYTQCFVYIWKLVWEIGTLYGTSTIININTCMLSWLCHRSIQGWKFEIYFSFLTWPCHWEIISFERWNTFLKCFGLLQCHRFLIGIRDFKRRVTLDLTVTYLCNVSFTMRYQIRSSARIYRN
jgi:hypothetical protein